MRLGVDGCRQDSGDCMSRRAGSEPHGCFFLGILKGASILVKQRHSTLISTSQLFIAAGFL